MPRAVEGAIHHMMVVAREDDRKVEVAAGDLVLALVEVAERKDQVTVVLFLQLLLVEGQPESQIAAPREVCKHVLYMCFRSSS